MGFFGGGGGTTPVNMVGASTGTAGTAGYVPAPAAGKNTRALFSDASFGEIPIVPAYKNTTANHWVGPYLPSRSDASAAPTAKSRIFIPIFVPSDGNIDTLGCIVAAAPASAFNIHLAMWECAEDGTPSSFVTGGTQTSGTTNSTVISVSVASTAVKRGFYYGSFTPDTTSAGVTFRSTARSSFLILGSFLGSSAGPTGQGGAPSNFGYTATTYNQTTHETMTLSGTDPVNIGFQYV